MIRVVRNIVLPTMLAVCLFACSGAPPESTIREVIAGHFRARGYQTVSIELGKADSLNIGEKTYMGTEAYRVEVLTIELRALEDIGPPWNHRPGQIIRARDGKITIKRSSARVEGWAVGSIEGIPVR